MDGDPVRLSQVVSNLLTDAAKYAPSGRHNLPFIASARSKRPGGAVACATPASASPRTSLPRLFDLFVQEREVLDRSQGGLGIGLTVVRGLVDRLHSLSRNAEVGDEIGRPERGVVGLQISRAMYRSGSTRTPPAFKSHGICGRPGVSFSKVFS